MSADVQKRPGLGPGRVVRWWCLMPLGLCRVRLHKLALIIVSFAGRGFRRAEGAGGSGLGGVWTGLGASHRWAGGNRLRCGGAGRGVAM